MRYARACAATRKSVFLWVAIDPLTKCLPVFQVGPRTHQMAQRLDHRLRALLAPGCLPLFTSDGLNAYFYVALRAFWRLDHGSWDQEQKATVAGGTRLALWAGA